MGLLLLFAAFYWLSDLIVYILVAFLISMLGRPAVKLLHNRLKIPTSLCSIIVLVVIIGILCLLVWLIFPLFVKQAQQLAGIDYNSLSQQATVLGNEFIEWLNNKGVALTTEEVSGYFSKSLHELWLQINMQDILSSFAGKITSFSIGLFSIIFLSFFFLRDESTFKRMLLLFVPDRHVERTENVLKSVESLLSRYFVGLSLEVVCMMILLCLGMWVLGVDNALLYGCLGGLLNIIPYLGPVIGAVLACLFAIFSHLQAGLSPDLFWLLIKIVGTFVAGNLIDNFILQPTIYSNSVKAHPLEIFFVILIAGTLTGIGGMILAIPCYTVIRIIAKEFFKETRLVKELTKRI